MTARFGKKAPPISPNAPTERPGPVGGKRDRNRREKIESLSKAALPLFLKSGVHAVTIDQIVKEAGFAKGNFYRYFKNKQELVQALFSPLVTGFEQIFERALTSMKSAKGNDELTQIYQQLGGDIFTLIISEPDTVLLYLQECRLPPPSNARSPISFLAELIHSSSLELTKAAQLHGLLRPLNPNLTTLTVIGASERLLYDYLRGGPKDFGNPIALLQDLVSMVLHGLLSKPS
jgi:AcrR family transcriptional regulator